MNTFFTVWFLINGIWYANYFDGWIAYDKKSVNECLIAVDFARKQENRIVVNIQQEFSCETDDTPKQKSIGTPGR